MNHPDDATSISAAALEYFREQYEISPTPWSENRLKMAELSLKSAKREFRALMANDPLPLRSVRVSDAVWVAARAKSLERGDNLSAVIRAALERYIKSK